MFINFFKTCPSFSFWIFLVIFIFSNANCQYSKFQSPFCIYESCHPPKPGFLNVHIVCHTHLDTGWVETFDQYYYKYVRMILESVTANLIVNSNRKFIFVETSFFKRWWDEQDHITREKVRWLVNTGQLEFINGGWSMNDEATVNYQAIIDQMTLGHRWLNRTLGHCAKPKIGWQIDPFGHSREQASIFSQIGFDGIFLGRIDFQDKLQREQSKTMEFVWKASPSIGRNSDIFTGVLPNVYWPPKGFCFDLNCFDEEIDEVNAEHRAREFIRMVKNQATKYLTNNTIITMGMDFYYRDAGKWYRNLDHLIAAINNLEHQTGVHAFYSTPSCYLKSLYQSNQLWPIKLDDFFPYADSPNAYWTGYYTSRPSLKYQIKYANGVLQAAKQLIVLAQLGDAEANQLRSMQETLGILQHHDAVTGTCKQFVADDYSRMLHQSLKQVQASIINSFYKIWSPVSNLSEPIHFCDQLNISQCHITESINHDLSTVIYIYNPLAQLAKTYVRVPVFGDKFIVKNSADRPVISQIVENHDVINKLPARKTSSYTELVFKAHLPPLGFTTFVIEKTLSVRDDYSSQIIHPNKNIGEVLITNGRISAVIDSQTGLLSAIVLQNGVQIPLKQNFYIYRAEVGSFEEKPSGAYAFNPTENELDPAAHLAQYKIIKGPLVQEIHQVFNSWVSQVIRIHQSSDEIEFDWVVGPIPVEKWYYMSGREIISKFETNFLTNGTFFTDNNGRETLRRVRNHRSTWNWFSTEKIASNYYPVTSWIFIRDYNQNLQLTILPDRPQGGSSIEDGSIEMMVHRRLMIDDGFGMNEALNEPGEDSRGLVVRGKFLLFVDTFQESIRKMRILCKYLTLPPVIVFRQKRKFQSHLQSFHADPLERIEFSGLKKRLSPNIHLLTLERWDDNRILLRLEHLFEINEDQKYSRPKRISFEHLFSPFKITSATEMTLNGITEKKIFERTKLRWNTRFDPYSNYTNFSNQPDKEDDNEFLDPSTNGPSSSLSIIIYPMEIKTFLITFELKKICIRHTSSATRVQQFLDSC